MGCYYTLCHNTYAYSLLFYKVYIRRENAGSWNSGLEKEQILETYSAQHQKSWNSTKVIFGNNKKYWAEEIRQGGLHLATRVGARPTPWARPLPWRNQSRAPTELFCRETSLREGEIITIVITNDPLIGRGSISINIFTSTISSQTLVHLLYPIFVSKPSDWYLWVASSVDYSL